MREGEGKMKGSKLEERKEDREGKRGGGRWGRER